VDDDKDMTDVGFPSPGLENRAKRIREESGTGDDETDDGENVNDIDDYADRADKDYEEGGQGFEEVDTQEEEEETAEEDAANKGPPAKTRKANDGKKLAAVKKKTCGCDNAVSTATFNSSRKASALPPFSTVISSRHG
jgi:hypothetical protein